VDWVRGGGVRLGIAQAAFLLCLSDTFSNQKINSLFEIHN
jgi:hypothetical protein